MSYKLQGFSPEKLTILSSSNALENMEAAILAGASSYLIKDMIGIDEMADAVRLAAVN